jgi:hypothetical protein
VEKYDGGLWYFESFRLGANEGLMGENDHCIDVIIVSYRKRNRTRSIISNTFNIHPSCLILNKSPFLRVCIFGKW